jgi:hypothetical protein
MCSRNYSVWLHINELGLAMAWEWYLYKSQILEGVLVQKQNPTSWGLKLNASVSQFSGTKRTHSRIPELG